MRFMDARKSATPLTPTERKAALMAAEIDNDMVTTDDGSMVKVVMTSEALRRSEPFRFMSRERAVELEATGECEIVRRRSKPSREMLDLFSPSSKAGVEVRLLKCEHLDPNLRCYGPVGYYGEEKALAGERAGSWRILWDSDLSPSDKRPSAFKTGPVRAFRAVGGAVRKAKVAWVQDSTATGGAELTCSETVRVGSQLGYLIDVITPTSHSLAHAESILVSADLIILNNLFGFPREHLRMLNRCRIRVPYVKFEHDHRELDRPEFSRRLFGRSMLNVFLSPMHMRNHIERLGCSGMALPLSIDADLFRPVPGVERGKGKALVPNVRNFKTWKDLQAYVDQRPEIEFSILAADSVIVGKNVRQMDPIPHDQMPRIYSAFEMLVHLPDGYGAGERVVFEAALCGCKIISNDRVGHISWRRDLSDSDGLREWLSQAPYEFWREVRHQLEERAKQ